MIEKLAIRIKGIKYKICLNSSYKFASKKINKKIIDAIVVRIEPSNIWLTDLENILFSLKGNKINPTNDKKGNLKNNQIKI